MSKNRNDSANSIKLLVLICFLWLFAATVFAQKRLSSQSIVSEADKYLNQLVQKEHFSGSVLIARGGKVLMSKGYGMANLTYQIPNTPQTKFLLASMTKAFTAIAVMILQERGLLSLDDSICKHIPQCPGSWEPVKLQHLLNHTSGITEFGKPRPENDCFRRTPMTSVQAMERVKQFIPDFKPGEKFAYSTVGFVLLGYVVEKVSGKAYEDFLKENIFEPLKMNNTGLSRQKAIVNQIASGYALAKDGTISNFDYFNLDYLFSAGGLYSTVEDLYLLEQGLNSRKLLNEASLKSIFTPGLENFGYGWEILEKNNRRLIRTDGRSFGFSNSLLSYPDERVIVVILSNVDTAGATKIADNLSLIVFRDKQ